MSQANRFRTLFRAAKFAVGLGLAAGTLPALAASDPDPIVVDASNPPFMYEAQGEAKGIYPALILEIYKRMGEPVKIEPTPWRRALEIVDAGRAGIGGVYKNAARLEKYAYTDGLFEEVIEVITPKGVTLPAASVEALKGKHIGVILGWSYGDEIDDAIKAGTLTVEAVRGDEQNISKLAAGRIDVVLTVREAGRAAIASLGVADKVSVQPTPLLQNTAYIAFAKSTNPAAKIERINQALKQIRGDGTFDKIVANTLGGH